MKYVRFKNNLTIDKGKLMSNHKNPYAKLKESDPDYLAYMKELEAINTKLHQQNIKYQVQRISDKNRISELEKQLQEASERTMIQISTRDDDSSEKS